MELLFNDFSLAGQFCSVDDFIENLACDILPILVRSKKPGVGILSKTTTYSLFVTENLTLHDILINKNSNISYPEITRLKSVIAEFIDDPHWDNDVKTAVDSSYELTHDCDIPNCITEALERNGILISFQHSDFHGKHISLCKNGEDKRVRNSINDALFCEHLIDSNHITFVEFLLACLSGKKVSFSKNERGDYRADKLYQNGDLNSVDMITIKDDLVRMFMHLADGETSRFVKAMTHKKMKYFVFRTTISDGRELRIPYLHYDEGIVFLLAYIKKTEQIPKSILSEMEKSAKPYQR